MTYLNLGYNANLEQYRQEQGLDSYEIGRVLMIMITVFDGGHDARIKMGKVFKPFP